MTVPLSPSANASRPALCAPPGRAAVCFGGAPLPPSSCSRKTGPLLGAASSALLNALKKLAGIDQEEDLVSCRAIEPIQTLKTNYLGSKNPRLHTDEILIALSSSAAENETAAKALRQLCKLKGCDMHSTVILSSVDTDTIKRLGMYLTCEPVYEEEDRKYQALIFLPYDMPQKPVPRNFHGTGFSDAFYSE